MSYFLDIFDGMAARAFNQCSRYGAALDQICDRATNSCIYMFLSVLYPKISFAFFLCFLLDFGAHWLQFQSTAFLKSESHKGKNAKENWLVSLYYNNTTLFQIVVGGAELGTGLLFVFGVYPWMWDILPLAVLEVVLLVILTFKMYVNVYQWFGATARFRENQHLIDGDKREDKREKSPNKAKKAKRSKIE